VTQDEPRFRPPSLDELDGCGEADSEVELRPLGSVEVQSPEGPQVWTPDRLASGVVALGHVLDVAPEAIVVGDGRRPRAMDERPIALAAGALERPEERLWVEWAADHDAVLVLAGSEEALKWATSWVRPHYVLGGVTAAREALAFSVEQDGSGRWARRFRRLERWVLSGWEEGTDRLARVPPDLVEGWGARGVAVEPFRPV
jgi:hypothetical protein